MPEKEKGREQTKEEKREQRKREDIQKSKTKINKKDIIILSQERLDETEKVHETERPSGRQ